MTFDINVTIRDTRCAASLSSRIPITTGCRGEFRAVLHPDESWDGMDKTVVFRAGHIERSRYIGTGTGCLVPPEVLASTASALEIGVYGTIGGDVVRTTTFARVGGVLQGARPTDDPTQTPDLYAQLLAEMAAAVKTVNGQAPDENGNVTVDGGGGGAGTPGGYYTPTVTQPDENTMRVSYAASQDGMTDVPDVDVTLPQGQPGAAGKTAYEYARDGGYTGTEEEFAAKLAQEKFANPNALTFTGAVTGSYDGTDPLEVAIPSGVGASYQSWSKVWTLAVAEDIAGFAASNIDLDGKSEIMIVFISDSTASRTMVNGRLIINGVDAGKVLFNSLPLKKDSHSFIIIGRADDGIEYTTMAAKAEYQTYPWQGDVNVVHRIVRGTNTVISWIAGSTIEITQASATLGKGVTIEIYVR